MNRKVLVTSIIIVATISLIIASYSTGTIAALASINLIGALIAAFTLIVGFAWFLKTSKKVK